MRLTNIQLDLSYAGTEHPMSFEITTRFGKKIESFEYTKWEVEKRAQQYYKAGEAQYRKGNYAKALAEWEKSLIWVPDNTELKEKIKQTQKELEVEADKKLSENYITQAYTYYEEGDLIKALDCWHKLLELDPDNKRAQEYVEKINSKLTETEKQKYLDEQESRKKEEMALHMRKADIFTDKEMYLEAINEWNEVLKLDPAHAEAKENIGKTNVTIAQAVTAHYQQGESCYKSGDNARALEEFRKALKLNPQHAESKKYIEDIRKQVAKPVKERGGKNIFDKTNSDQLYYRAADQYLAGNYADAETTLKELLSKDPFNENALLLLDKVKSVLKTLDGK